MHIKIYFGDKPVFLCDTISKELNEILHHPNAVFIDEISPPAIKSLLHEIKKDAFSAGVILHNNLDELKKVFFKNFTFIEAAGGIVQNASNEILFIYRLDKWDLPKGKMEKNEKPNEAALREVQEETSVAHLTLKKMIGETYHTYNAFGKHFLKIIYWYHFACQGKQHLSPQTAEDITALQWIAAKNCKEPLSNTYPSIKDIVNIFLNL